MGTVANADRPISSRKDDLLGRADFGEALAAEILRAPADGYVIGLTGAWGSGKTSIINMALEALGTDRAWVLRFNPWLFSGTEQLVSSFFRELSSQLLERDKTKLETVAKRLEQYGEVVEPLGALPFVGKWISGTRGLARFVAARFSPGRRGVAGSAESERRSVESELRGLPKRVVVVIDDIDRLQRSEIADVMRLVRLIADFPNVVYVLAFDRLRVEEALGAGELDRGREHLEKIVQATFEVPSVRNADLARVLLEETQAAIEGLPAGPFDVSRWQNVFALVIRPLLDSMRDVRRYVNALPHALTTIGEEVALTDVLALEAVRVAAPEVADRLPELVDELTDVSNSTGRVNDAVRAERTTKLRALIAAGATHSRAVEEMLRVLFPATQRYLSNTIYGPNSAAQWRSERLVADESILRFYLERSLPKGVLGAATVKRLFDSLSDEAGLRVAFAAMDPETLENALARLEDFEDAYPPESVPVALPIILDTLPRLQEGNRPMFDPGASIRVTRVALRLLKRVEDQSQRAEIAANTLPKLKSLSAALELVEMVGYRDGAGHKLVSEADAASLEARLREMILSADPSRLASERELFLLWYWAAAGNTAAVSARLPTLVNDDAFFVRFIESALSESRSQSIGEVAVRREYRLPWDGLIKLLGEEHLSARIAAIDPFALEEGRDRLAVETARRYSSGWRPKHNW